LMKAHGATRRDIQRMITYIIMKAIYYAIIGKYEISKLHIAAVIDFNNGIMGRKHLAFSITYMNNAYIESVFLDTTIKNILIPWTIDLQNTGLLGALKEAVLKRTDLHVVFLTEPGGKRNSQFPSAALKYIYSFLLLPFVTYNRLRKKYDLVLQSEYRPIIPISWLNAPILFVNNKEHYKIPAVNLIKTFGLLMNMLKKMAKL
jgi:hypothetical protein